MSTIRLWTQAGSACRSTAGASSLWDYEGTCSCRKVITLNGLQSAIDLFIEMASEIFTTSTLIGSNNSLNHEQLTTRYVTLALSDMRYRITLSGNRGPIRQSQ